MKYWRVFWTYMWDVITEPFEDTELYFNDDGRLIKRVWINKK